MKHNNKIKTECSDFLIESEGSPLIKQLPRKYKNFQKVKVRQKKGSTYTTEALNTAFNASNLHQRAIFVNNQYINDDFNEFYIFPINGYKFLYSEEIKSYTDTHREIFETLLKSNLPSDEILTLIHSFIKFTYNDKNLLNAIKHNCEIILYNIPYYYAVRKSIFNDYNYLLNVIENKRLICTK